MNILARKEAKLEDLRASGKKENWRKYRQQSRAVRQMFLKALAIGLRPIGVTTKYLTAQDLCGHKLYFDRDDEQLLHLTGAKFCHHRECPMCNRRRSLLIGGQMRAVTSEILSSNPKVRFLSVSLTVKNVAGENLRAELEHLNFALRRIYSAGKKIWTHELKTRLQKTCLGSMTSIEITYNREHDDFHPHVHCLIAVDGSYFDRQSDAYLTHRDFITLWRDALGIDYDPSVRVKAVPNLAGAIAEVAKYPTKLADLFVDPTNEIEYIKSVRALVTIHNAMYRKHLMNFRGILREFRKKLRLENLEAADADLIGKSNLPYNKIGEEIYQWFDNRRDYFLIYSISTGPPG